MKQRFVGLMSGTSMDGIDAAVVAFGDHSIELLGTHTHPYPPSLKTALQVEIRRPLDEPIDADGTLNQRVGDAFAEAALAVVQHADMDARDITAIGSHGQTLRHQPDGERPFSLQIGDADRIAKRCGVPTVANFRNADIAAGGQGAPLAPRFHEWLFRVPDESRIVANLGGISNITLIDDDDVIGFDTGPGNGLMDRWIAKHRDMPFDHSGSWAKSGTVVPALLEAFLADPYFAKAPPKSTGFEYFNEQWLANFELADYAAVDVQATLAELTAASVAIGSAAHGGDIDRFFVCGGGAHNDHLLDRLRHYLPSVEVDTTDALGLHPDWVEAVAFAWLAMRTMNGQSGNLPSVTGASRKVVLGDIHSP